MMTTNLSVNQLFEAMCRAAAKQLGFNPRIVKGCMHYTPGTSDSSKGLYTFKDNDYDTTLSFNLKTGVIVLQPSLRFPAGWPAGLLASYRKTDQEMNQEASKALEDAKAVQASKLFARLKVELYQAIGNELMYTGETPLPVVTITSRVEEELNAKAPDALELLHQTGSSNGNELTYHLLQAFNQHQMRELFYRLSRTSAWQPLLTAIKMHKDTPHTDPSYGLMEDGMRKALELATAPVQGATPSVVYAIALNHLQGNTL